MNVKWLVFCTMPGFAHSGKQYRIWKSGSSLLSAAPQDSTMAAHPLPAVSCLTPPGGLPGSPGSPGGASVECA